MYVDNMIKRKIIISMPSDWKSHFFIKIVKKNHLKDKKDLTQNAQIISVLVGCRPSRFEYSISFQF